MMDALTAPKIVVMESNQRLNNVMMEIMLMETVVLQHALYRINSNIRLL